MKCEQLQGQDGYNTWSNIKMPFRQIYSIGWAWKSNVKVGHIKKFMRKNKSSTKRIFLSLFPKYGT